MGDAGGRGGLRPKRMEKIRVRVIILEKGRQEARRMARRLVLAVACGADGKAGLQVEA